MHECVCVCVCVREREKERERERERMRSCLFVGPIGLGLCDRGKPHGLRIYR